MLGDGLGIAGGCPGESRAFVPLAYQDLLALGFEAGCALGGRHTDLPAGRDRYREARGTHVGRARVEGINFQFLVILAHVGGNATPAQETQLGCGLLERVQAEVHVVAHVDLDAAPTKKGM